MHNCARMYNDCLSEAGRPVVAIWAYAFPAPDIHIPRQLDTYNCAMYMLMFAYRLVRAFAMFTTASSHTSPSTVGERAHLTRIVRHGLAEPHAVQGGCAGTQPPGRVTNVDIPRTTPPLASSQPSIASSTQLPSGFGRRVVSFPLNYLTGRPQKDKKTPCTRRHKGEVAWARTAARSSEVGRGAPAGPHGKRAASVNTMRNVTRGTLASPEPTSERVLRSGLAGAALSQAVCGVVPVPRAPAEPRFASTSACLASARRRCPEATARMRECRRGTGGKRMGHQYVSGPRKMQDYTRSATTHVSCRIAGRSAAAVARRARACGWPSSRSHASVHITRGSPTPLRPADATLSPAAVGALFALTTPTPRLHLPPLARPAQHFVLGTSDVGSAERRARNGGLVVARWGTIG